MIYTYDFTEEPKVGGIGGWYGFPIPGLSSCGFNTLWQTGGYWEMTDTCTALGRYLGECNLILYLPNLQWDQIVVNITAEHRYLGPTNDTVKVYTTPDLFVNTLQDTYILPAAGADTSFGPQDITLTPAAMAGDNYVFFIYNAWGSNNIGVDPEVRITINSVTFYNSDELRHLGLDADGGKLYVTTNQGGTLKSLAYNLETLVLEATQEFGAATYAQLDARTHGIFPVVKPGVDDNVFIRGRDGSDAQVYLSDDGGESFSDLSDGGWGTQYAVGLHPDRLNPDDIVVPFSNDDIYRSQDTGANWTKTGDASVNLRTTIREFENEHNMLLAGQVGGAADTFWTPNYGATDVDTSDAAIGIIDGLEQSLE